MITVVDHAAAGRQPLYMPYDEAMAMFQQLWSAVVPLQETIIRQGAQMTTVQSMIDADTVSIQQLDIQLNATNAALVQLQANVTAAVANLEAQIAAGQPIDLTELNSIIGQAQADSNIVAVNVGNVAAALPVTPAPAPAPATD